MQSSLGKSLIYYIHNFYNLGKTGYTLYVIISILLNFKQNKIGETTRSTIYATICRFYLITW